MERARPGVDPVSQGRRREFTPWGARYDVRSAIHEQGPIVDILVMDVTVQGSEAPTSIASGMHHLDHPEDVSHLA